ncbi:MAG: porin [Ignavibacteria bacterium]|nr:porin [Ignavibacteria bacterium]
MKILKSSVYEAITLFMLISACFTLSTANLHAQSESKAETKVDFEEKGIKFSSSDSVSDVTMGFRTQSWATYTTVSTSDFSAASTFMAVRRMRLKFDGHLFSKQLRFKLELGFSRSDLNAGDPNIANPILDAVVFWDFTKNLQVSFGQTKLPGNRQRVVSSSQMEYADRTIVNSAFNPDRDFGLQAFWRPIHGDVILNLRGAITEGGGRNQLTNPGGGFAYTGRAEILPLGEFKKGGDYFEGDLLHESTPKLSVGITMHHNEGAGKTMGTLGTPLFALRNQDIVYADAVLKYSGLCIYSEYGQRTSADPVTVNPKDSTATSTVVVGSGWMAQASYTFPSMWTVGVRYAEVDPSDQLKGLSSYHKDQNFATMVGYYIDAHKIKAQLEVGENMRTLLNANNLENANYYTRLNFELGI